MKLVTRILRDKKGAALVEYGLLIAGVALIAAAGVAIFGHKTNDLISATASVLPGAHADDNGPIFSGKLIETTTPTVTDGITVDADAILNGGTDQSRLGNNLGWAVDSLVLDE